MQQIEITVNGTATRIEPSTNLAALLKEAGFDTRYAAVVVNETFVPHPDHEAQRLEAGDRIEILTPFAGG